MAWGFIRTQLRVKHLLNTLLAKQITPLTILTLMRNFFMVVYTQGLIALRTQVRVSP